jgi:hypothetical protein
MIIQDAILVLIKMMIKKSVCIFTKKDIKFPLIQLSCFEYARKLFIDNNKDLMNFVKIKTFSTPDLFSEYDMYKKYVKDYYNEINKQFKKIHNIKILEVFTYESSLIQEQAHSDSYRNNNNLLLFSCLLIPVIFVDFYVLNLFKNHVIFLILYICWLPIAYYFFKRMKIKYAYYLLWSYLESFNIGDSAEIADRAV